MSSSAARTFKQGVFGGNSFKRQPLSSTIQMVIEAFPEIDHVKNFVTDKVAALTSSDGCEVDATGPSRIEAERSEAVWVVKQFCKIYLPTSFDPTPEELDDFWARCAKFRPSSVTHAICDQLSRGWSGAETDWQPQFRALRLLESMRARPGSWGTTARNLVADLRQLLIFLDVEAPQFKSITGRLLSAHPRGTSPPASPQLSFRAVAYEAANEPCCRFETCSQPSTEATQPPSRASSVESEFLENDSPPAEQPLPLIPQAPEQRRGGSECAWHTACAEHDVARPSLWQPAVETITIERERTPLPSSSVFRRPTVLPL
eukprot:TRINITY_DN38214_c0_g1_i1.p1 TRINITY_DN38214_c0_g1~~TRINITY_DN38214_c0_g1_i1.p1  ORF type:complete len:333 (+),score=46.03 TRINITY_DN38214_c0_g1_i1:50-1000(+)